MKLSVGLTLLLLSTLLAGCHADDHKEGSACDDYVVKHQKHVAEASSDEKRQEHQAHVDYYKSVGDRYNSCDGKLLDEDENSWS